MKEDKKEKSGFLKTSPSDNIRSIGIIVSALIIGAAGYASIKIDGFIFPFTIQSLPVFLFAALFGGMAGSGPTGLFLIMGALGLPFYSFGNRGVAYLTGNTGGFLIGYFIASMVIGLYLGKPDLENRTSFKKIFLSMLIGILVVYIMGVAQFFKVMNFKLSMQSLSLIFNKNVFYYLAADLIKIILASTGAYFLRPLCGKFFYDERGTIE